MKKALKVKKVKRAVLVPSLGKGVSAASSGDVLGISKRF
jgi:hypothetical protein